MKAICFVDGDDSGYNSLSRPSTTSTTLRSQTAKTRVDPPSSSCGGKTIAEFPEEPDSHDYVYNTILTGEDISTDYELVPKSGIRVGPKRGLASIPTLTQTRPLSSHPSQS